MKKNVEKFNRDVQSNEGFKYTTNAPHSSIIANLRISTAIHNMVPKGTKSIVDCGCGDGTYTAEVKKRFPRINVEAFDPASDAIKIASGRYPKIVFSVVNLLEKKTLPKKRYDLAIVRGVLHHLSDQALALENALSLSDTVVIMEPNGNNPILKQIEKRSKYHIEHEERSFSYTQLKQFIEDAGGEVDEIEYVGFVPFFAPEFFARIIYFFQPILEKIPLINYFFSAQMIIKIRKI